MNRFFLTIGILHSLTQLPAQDIYKLAFGSCSDQDRPQELWDDVIAAQPDWWIWLGDNIYGDTEDMTVMAAKYNKQRSNEQYQQLLSFAQVDGVWDDHDYGANNAGKEYPQKEASEELLLDFLEVEANDPRRSRPGTYGVRYIEWEGLQIALLLLDTRYFRDPITAKGKGTLLGPDQWRWLEETLASSQADVHIIASSIQVIPEDHRYEKWANFPAERTRLFDLLHEYEVSKPLFISGDRHIGEISRLEWKGRTYHDVTSSSLTHTWNQDKPEKNRHRVGHLIGVNNYGLVTLEKLNNQLSIKAALIGEDNELLELMSIN